MVPFPRATFSWLIGMNFSPGMTTPHDDAIDGQQWALDCFGIWNEITTAYKSCDNSDWHLVSMHRPLSNSELLNPWYIMHSELISLLIRGEHFSSKTWGRASLELYYNCFPDTNYTWIVTHLRHIRLCCCLRSKLPLRPLYMNVYAVWEFYICGNEK